MKGMPSMASAATATIAVASIWATASTRTVVVGMMPPSPTPASSSAPVALFDVFRQPDVAGPPPLSSQEGSTLTHLGPDDEWTPSPQPGTWHESSIWNETDVFLAQLTRTTTTKSGAGKGQGKRADSDWTMKIGRGGQLYSLTLPSSHRNDDLGELLPPQDDDVSPWTDDCFVTTLYDTVNMDGDPKLEEFGMNWLQNGYYVKPTMDPTLQSAFYEPILGEYFNASSGEEGRSYSTIHVRFTSQPSIHRSDGIMYNRYRDMGDGIIEITYYFYNFGDNIHQDSLTFPWGGVRTSVLPHHIKGNDDGTFINYGSQDVDGYHVKDSGGWLGCTQDGSDPDGVTVALVHGVDRHYMDPDGHLDQTPITSRVGDTNPSRDFTTMATYYDHPIRPGQSYFFRTYLVVGLLGDVGPRAAGMVDSVDYGHVHVDVSTASRLKLYVTVTSDGQTILTTEKPAPESEPIGESYAVPISNSYPLLLVREVESGRYVLTTDPYVVCSKNRFDNPYEPGNPRYERYEDRVVYRPYDGKTKWVGLLGYLPTSDDGEGAGGEEGEVRLASSVFDELGVIFVPGERVRAHELSILTTTTAADPNTAADDDSPPRFVVDPITASPARQGVPYEDTIVGTAEDVDGDIVWYDKILGPSWLVVSLDGSVRGTPGPTDAGLNTFAVRATSSSSGDGTSNRTDVATLRVDVESNVDVVIERCSPGVKDWMGCFPTLSGPSSEDYADAHQENQDVSISVTTDRPPVSAGTSYLVNGVGQGFAEDVLQSVFFDNHGKPNRVLVDLGKVVAVERIDTYSWHVNSRIEQKFDLYYYEPPPPSCSDEGESCSVVDDEDGSQPPDSSSAVRSADLAGLGWVPLAVIRAGVEKLIDTQVGVSVRSKGFEGGGDGGDGDVDVLMRARYVLFDIKDSFTLYGEFDVYATEEVSPPPPTPPPTPPPPPPPPAEAEVVVERNSPGVPDWHFHTIDGPSSIDCADSTSSSQCADDGADVKISVTTDNQPKTANVTALLDGFIQTAGEDVLRSVFFDADEPNRILLDLGAVRRVRRINTYSWHVNVRANQVYDLYYHRGDGSDGSPPSGSDIGGAEDLEAAGWIPLASVVTEYSTAEENQVGVSVRNADDSGCVLTEARYLLFDIKYRYTVYGEFDVYVNSPPKFTTDPPPILRSVADVGVPYTGTIAGKATDADGDTLTYEKLTGPSWLTVDGDGTLSGTPQASDSGTNAFEVRVSDGCGGMDESNFVVLVSLVEVTVGRNSPGTADWTFDSIDGPSAADYADASQNHATISVTTDNQPQHADVTFLLSGAAQSSNEDVWHSVFFDADEPNRVLLDLGDVREVLRVNTYSWHLNVRANQVYDLYYFYEEDDDGNIPPASGSEVRSDSLVDLGWRALASVDTKYPTDVENQVGVSVGNPLGAGEALTYARFLLFDIKYRFTVYGEFDVYVA